ncbi:uncharacterized protein JCM6883_001612 [Sporobolomyces salmoneus]|uniref:uncharacterized protein n=1 Tax=Sporobolomyces salmoneus TaxID=183962 RepID=UPI0031819695
MSWTRQSPSSTSTSPSSISAAPLKTPPFTPSKLPADYSNSPRSPPPSTVTVSESPTSAFLASALGGLSLRDGDSPVKSRTGGMNGGGLEGSLNFATTRGNGASTAFGLSETGHRGDSGRGDQMKGLRHATSFDELTMLAISSSLTELSMSIEEVSTLIFEIQELRHTSSTSSKPTTSNETSKNGNEDSNNAVSEMDKALMRLDARLEDVRKELVEIEKQVKPLVEGPASKDEPNEIYFLREKWKTTLEEWDSVQKDAEMLGDELKEDKYLLVFNSVIKQAEDMMRSLEKILNQSHQFVWDVNRRKGKSNSSSSSDYFSPSNRTFPTSTSASSVSSLSSSVPPQLHPNDIQPLLSSFVALHRSLHAKVKYYSPACDRVLRMLGKGIEDRTTKNGEVLRRYAEMRTRWKELQERITRIEAEMRGVEDILREAAGPDEMKDNSEKSKTSAEFGNTLTPPRESPANGGSGKISSLRRLANKISPNSTPTRPDRFWRQSSLGPSSASSSPPASSAMLPSTSGTSTSPSVKSTGSKATPPRPPKSSKRSVNACSTPPPPLPQTPQSRPPLSHRRSTSALAASTGASASGKPIPRRAISPMPTPAASLADRPRWNPSTKKTTEEEREVLTQIALGKGRPSLAPGGGGGGTPLANRSGRNSSMGLRSSSRMSMNSSMSRSYNGGNRPVSPAFSDASSAVRERPSTPSRIPRPSSVIRPRSTTPYSSYEGPGNTSIMQRMASSPSTTSTNRSRPPPAPSNRYSLSRSAGPSSFTMPRSSSASLLPTTSTLNGNLSPPRAVSPSPSANSSFSYRGHTPEPSLMAHAKRLANVRAPRPPPVPRLPSNSSTPRANPSSSSSRPPSSLGYGGRSGAFSPLPNGESTALAYSSNPHDPLDLAVGEIVNSLPLALHVARVDPHLTRAQAGSVELFSARYSFSLSPIEDYQRRAAAVMLKLVDRVGPRARKGEKKVLARVGAGWQDLESHCLSLIAQAM